MADVASWADELLATHRQTGAWHYVDIPTDAPGYDVERYCPRNQCVVAKIGRYFRIQRDGSRSDADREEALKFVIHFVGDVHQPLHAADRHDRGGNDVRVVYAVRDVNLHHVWDTELVEAEAGGQAALVEASIRARRTRRRGPRRTRSRGRTPPMPRPWRSPTARCRPTRPRIYPARMPPRRCPSWTRSSGRRVCGWRQR